MVAPFASAAMARRHADYNEADSVVAGIAEKIESVGLQ
jgi:hypothetical protein